MAKSKANLRLPLRKRVDAVVARLNAASINAAPGAVELNNELFDDMADVLEEMEVLIYGPRKD